MTASSLDTPVQPRLRVPYPGHASCIALPIGFMRVDLELDCNDGRSTVGRALAIAPA
jgi:hypothetical protein